MSASTIGRVGPPTVNIRGRTSRVRRQPSPCPVEGCDGEQTKTGYCDTHSHDWIAAAEIPIANSRAAGALRRAAVTLNEGTWCKVLDVYCLGGDERFLTRDGWRTFEDTAGTSQLVLTADISAGQTAHPARTGRWVEAEIRSFGEQRLRTVTLTRNGVQRVIRATPEHRWWVSSDSGRARLTVRTTAELRAGDMLPTILLRDNVRQSTPSPFGVAHGIVFGDGSRANLRGASNGAYIDLWGEKDRALLRYFNEAPTRPVVIKRSGLTGIRVTGLPAAWKEQPPLDEGVPYLYGWLAGYFAADGTVSKTGLPSLSSADRDALAYAEAVATRLGLTTLGITTSHRIGYGTDPTPLHQLTFARTGALRAEFFLIPEHRRRFEARGLVGSRLRWRVVSVEDHGEAEEVFCAVVPDTHAFTIEGMILTHNCGHCRLPYGAARNGPCDSYSTVLRGGPMGTRKKRVELDEATG
jgi:DNA primase